MQALLRDASFAHTCALSLQNVLGDWSRELFAIALLASGQSSTITGTYAGQYVMQVRRRSKRPGPFLGKHARIACLRSRCRGRHFISDLIEAGRDAQRDFLCSKSFAHSCNRSWASHMHKMQETVSKTGATGVSFFMKGPVQCYPRSDSKGSEPSILETLSLSDFRTKRHLSQTWTYTSEGEAVIACLRL
jgi:hypothetical protein